MVSTVSAASMASMAIEVGGRMGILLWWQRSVVLRREVLRRLNQALLMHSLGTVEEVVLRLRTGDGVGQDRG